jgi:hypothetical protein
MLPGMAFQVHFNSFIMRKWLRVIQVTEDLVSYMGYAMSEGNNFLVDDPDWAIDFAPNGMFWFSASRYERCLICIGTLLKLGDTITRKRYAEYVLQWKHSRASA